MPCHAVPFEPAEDRGSRLGRSDVDGRRADSVAEARWRHLPDDFIRANHRAKLGYSFKNKCDLGRATWLLREDEVLPTRSDDGLLKVATKSLSEGRWGLLRKRTPSPPAANEQGQTGPGR